MTDFAYKPTLTGDLVVLRPVNERDYEALAVAMDGPLGVYAFNPRARRAYEKAGLRAEAVLRDALRWDGEWVDEIVMSVLAPDWVPSEGDPR